MTADLELTPYALDLATLASAAAFVDPGLLRALRLRFLPDADATAEACVWWSDTIEHRGANGLTFSPEALDTLRARLAQLEDTAAVFELVEQHHAGGPPLLLLEEKLVEIDVLAADAAEIEASLETAIAELDGPRGDEVLAWVERSLPRFPPRARASAGALTLSLALSKRFGIPLTLDVAPSSVNWQQLSRWLPDVDVPIEIRVEGDDLVVRHVPLSNQTLSVPATDPLLLVVEHGDVAETVTIPRAQSGRVGDGRRIGSASDVVTIANLRGDRWRVRGLPQATQPPQQARSTATRGPRFRWLQLSEMQLGRGRMPTDVEELVQTATREGPIDAVFVTGDLTMYGQAGEYALAARELDAIMASLTEAGQRPRIFLVPGNHDADQVAYAEHRPYIENWHQEATLREEFWRGTSELRGVVERAFANWTSYWPGNGILPGDFSSTVSVGGLRIGVVGLNNAFLHRSGGEVGGRDLDLRQLEAVCFDGIEAWVAAHDVRILLTHYPPEALHPRARVAFEQAIAPEGRFQIHLCGARRNKPNQYVRPRSLLWTGTPHWDFVRTSNERGHGVQGFDIGQLEAAATAFHVTMTRAGATPEVQRFEIERASETRQDLLVTADVVPDTGVWVLVDGTDQFELPPEQVELAKLFGEALARDGHSMITFGTQGVAHVAARAFMKVLRAQRYTSGIYRLLHIVPEGERADFFESGRTLFPTGGDSLVASALRRAHAIVTLGESSVSSELSARGAIEQVPAVSLLDGTTRGALELPELWKWKSSSERAALVSRRIGERMHVDASARDSALTPSLCRAARAIDERDLDDYNAMLEQIEAEPSLPSHVGHLLADARPSHRLLGYLWAREQDNDVPLLLQALQRELDTVRDFWETRTLWFALEAFRRSRRELPIGLARAFAALFVIIQRVLASNRRIDPGREIRRTLDRVEKQFEDHVVGRSGAIARANALADAAERYDSLRASTRGAERTQLLDSLANEIASKFPDAIAHEARAWFGGLSAGHRVVALALLEGSRDPHGIHIVLDVLRRPISAFEHYRALSVALALIGQIAPLQQERLMVTVEEQLSELAGDTARMGLARRIVAAISHARTLRAPSYWVSVQPRTRPAEPDFEAVITEDAVPGDIVTIFSDRPGAKPLGIYLVGKERRGRGPAVVVEKCHLQLDLPDAPLAPDEATQVDGLIERVVATRIGWASATNTELFDLLARIYSHDGETLEKLRSTFGIKEIIRPWSVTRAQRTWVHNRRRREHVAEIDVVWSPEIAIGDLVVAFSDRRPAAVYRVASARANRVAGSSPPTVTARCTLVLEIPPPASNFRDPNRRELYDIARKSPHQDTYSLGIHDRLITLILKMCSRDPELSAHVRQLFGVAGESTKSE